MTARPEPKILVRVIANYCLVRGKEAIQAGDTDESMALIIQGDTST